MRRWAKKWAIGVLALRQARTVWRRMPLPLGPKLLVFVVGAAGLFWWMRAQQRGTLAQRPFDGRPDEGADGAVLARDGRPLKDIN